MTFAADNPAYIHPVDSKKFNCELLHPPSDAHDLCTTTWHSPCGELLLGAVGGALCLCDWTASPKHPANLQRLIDHAGNYPRQALAPVLEVAIGHLTHYFQGLPRGFSLPLCPVGTDFQLRVWQALLHIPYGSTATYSELASMAGCPAAVRATARAVALNPLSIFIPCHRITGLNNPLAYAGGAEAKRYMLNIESSKRCPTVLPYPTK